MSSKKPPHTFFMFFIFFLCLLIPTLFVKTLVSLSQDSINIYLTKQDQHLTIPLSSIHDPVLRQHLVFLEGAVEQEPTTSNHFHDFGIVLLQSYALLKEEQFLNLSLSFFTEASLLAPSMGVDPSNIFSFYKNSQHPCTAHYQRQEVMDCLSFAVDDIS